VKDHNQERSTTFATCHAITAKAQEIDVHRTGDLKTTKHMIAAKRDAQTRGSNTLIPPSV
jgi:hypothetical protein